MDMFIKDYATHENAQGVKYITPGQSSLIVSILSAGTVVGMSTPYFILWRMFQWANIAVYRRSPGSLTANFFADWIGRRWGLVLSSVLFTVCLKSLPPYKYQYMTKARCLLYCIYSAVSLLKPYRLHSHSSLSVE